MPEITPTISFDEQLEVRTKTYTAFVGGRPVVVYGVPYLVDTDSDEEFLSPDVAQRLYEMVYNPGQRSNVIGADVYEWLDFIVVQPKLTIRMTGKGYEYGNTPISQFARAASRVSDSTVGLSKDRLRRKGYFKRKRDPRTTEPVLAWVGPGSLVFAVEAPREGLFPEQTEQAAIGEAIELIVDAAAWLISDEDSDIPDSLRDNSTRAEVLRHVERMLPSELEKDARIELSGQATNNKILSLNHSSKEKAQSFYSKAVAELQRGESVKIRAVLHQLSLNGKAKLKQVRWDTESETISTIDASFDVNDTFLRSRLASMWGKHVSVSGVLQRDRKENPKTLDLHFIDLDDREEEAQPLVEIEKKQT